MSFVIFGMFFAFLYMNIFLLSIFLLFSSLLIYMDRSFIFGLLKKNRYMLLYCVLPIACSLPFIAFKNYSTAPYFILNIYCLVVSCSLYKRIFDTYIAIKYLFYICSVCIFVYLYCTMGMYPDNGYHLEYMLGDGISANGVTSFAGMLCFMYMIMGFRLFRETYFLPCIINLYISYEGYGRGSIIFALMLIIINFIFFLLKLKTYKRFFVLLFSIISIASFIPYIYEAYLNTKFFTTGLDSPRIEMLRQYINNMDLYGLFFGVSYEGTMIAEFNNNPHMSYIRAHHIFGLYYIMLIALVPFVLFSRVVRNHDGVGLIVFIAILALLLRCASEPLLFPTLFDTFFFLALYVCCDKNLSTRGY